MSAVPVADSAMTAIGFPLEPKTKSPTQSSPCVFHPERVRTGVESAISLPCRGGIVTISRRIPSTPARVSVIAQSSFWRCVAIFQRPWVVPSANIPGLVNSRVRFKVSNSLSFQERVDERVGFGAPQFQGDVAIEWSFRGCCGGHHVQADQCSPLGNALVDLV